MKVMLLSLGLMMLFNNPSPTEMGSTITYCHQSINACSKNGTYNKKSPSNEFILGFGKFFKNDTLKVYLNGKLYYHGLVNTNLSMGRSDLAINYKFKATEKKVALKIILDSDRRKVKNQVTKANLDLSYSQVIVSLISEDKWIFDHNNHSRS